MAKPFVNIHSDIISDALTGASAARTAARPPAASNAPPPPTAAGSSFFQPPTPQAPSTSAAASLAPAVDAAVQQPSVDANAAELATTEPTADAATPNDLIQLEPGELAPLSETIQLDDLWNTLSDCLVELEETADHHAVLVLQPAVEAFFLVHASTSVQVPPANAAASAPAPTDAAAAAAPPQQPQSATAPATNEDNIHIDAATLADNLAAAATEQLPAVRPLSPIDDDGDGDGEIIDADVPSPDPVTIDEAAATNAASAIDVVQRMVEDDDDDEDDPAAREQSAAAAKSASAATPTAPLTEDQKKFLQFAEKHRTVLNQILRQSTVHLSDGPFAVLVDHTRILDFDVKRRYFRTELERMDEGVRREELAVHVHRVTVFEDSFRELYRRNPEEWKNRFYIVFEDEEGQDAGGLLREWYVIISREIFNPMYALFTVSPGDRVTYMINPSSHCNSNHLFYFKFVGRVIGECTLPVVVSEVKWAQRVFLPILVSSQGNLRQQAARVLFHARLLQAHSRHRGEHTGHGIGGLRFLQGSGVPDGEPHRFARLRSDVQLGGAGVWRDRGARSDTEWTQCGRVGEEQAVLHSLGVPAEDERFD